METLLKEYAQKNNINLTDEMMLQFNTYKTLLQEWNQKINLTAIIENRDIVIKHFIDSLTINPYIPENANVIDVGTGAGFPGIPLKIIRNDVNVVLLDSLNKRVNFLNEVIEKCNLKGIKAIHSRAEDAAQNKELREKFDIATARAVANISTLAEYCVPFVKLGGAFICMKADCEEEMEKAKNAVKILGIECEKIDKFILENTDANRTIITYRKSRATSAKYPRKAGLPAKEPLK